MDEADKILAANNDLSDYFDDSDLDDAMIMTALVLLLAQMITSVDYPKVALESVVSELRRTIPIIEEMREAV